MSVNSNNINSERDELNLKVLWLLLLENWKLFASCMFISLLIGAFFIWYSHPEFKMTATVLVGDESSDISQTMLDEVGVISKKKNVENEIAIITSRSLMNRTISQLDINVTYSANLGLRSRELYLKRPVNLEYVLTEGATDEFVITLDCNDEEQLLVTIEWESQDGEEQISTETISLGGQFSTPIGHFRIIPTSYYDQLVTGDSAYCKNYTLHYQSDVLVTTKYLGKLEVQLAREKASILQLTLEDKLKGRGEDILSTLLDVYINNSVERKNMLAIKFS